MRLKEGLHPLLTEERLVHLAAFQVERLAQLLAKTAEQLASILDLSFSTVRYIVVKEFNSTVIFLF